VRFYVQRYWFSKLLKIVDLMDLYRATNCIWKVKFKDCSERTEKPAYYEILNHKLHVANLDSVARTINNVRSQYRKESGGSCFQEVRCKN
jgi:hypothetical protein